MANYRRLISYIYAYEGGIKGKNVGFAKVEVRNGQCKLQVNVRNIYVGSQDTGVYLLCGSDEILVGKIFIRNGAGEFRAIIPVNNVAGSGQSIDKCYGLTVHNLADSWQSCTTIWEDAVTHAAEVVLAEAAAEQMEQKDMDSLQSAAAEEEAKPSIADAVEAEIEAQSRTQDPVPSSMVPPLESQPSRLLRSAEMEAMEVRPLGTVSPIGKQEEEREEQEEREKEEDRSDEREEKEESPSLSDEAPRFQSRQSQSPQAPVSFRPRSPRHNWRGLPAWNTQPEESEASGQSHRAAVLGTEQEPGRMKQETDQDGQGGMPSRRKAGEQQKPEKRTPEFFQAPQPEPAPPQPQSVQVPQPESTPLQSQPVQVPQPEPAPLQPQPVQVPQPESTPQQPQPVQVPQPASPQSKPVQVPRSESAPPQSKAIQLAQSGLPQTQWPWLESVPLQAGTRAWSQSGFAVPQPDSVRLTQPKSTPTQRPWPESALPKADTPLSVQPEPAQARLDSTGPAWRESEPVCPDAAQSASEQVQSAPPDSVQVQPGATQLSRSESAPADPVPQLTHPESAPASPVSAPIHPETPQLPPHPDRLEEEPRIDAIWQRFYKTYPKIQAFDYNGGCDILTIKPQDIGLLPREVWGYGNNSFLLHGYYSHRYLIFARLNNKKGEPRFLLGVPGHYYSNEKYMASMFGFPNFVLSKIQPAGDGRFGYWYTDIRAGR